MLPVRPNEELPIVRVLEDHTDSNTYYVRAVIKNARTFATLATLDLTDNGNREFSYNWRTPADPSAVGIYIIITTSVYTDSGYTAKAENYGDQAVTYKIEINRTSLGGGGADVDYAKVRRIVQEELDKLPKNDYPVPEKVNLTPLQTAVADVKRAITAIHIPQPEKPDFAPLIVKIEDVTKQIRNIPESDISPILEGLTELSQKMDPPLEEIKAESNKILSRLKEFFDADLESIKSDTKALREKFEELPYVVIERKKDESE